MVLFSSLMSKNFGFCVELVEKNVVLLLFLCMVKVIKSFLVSLYL